MLGNATAQIKKKKERKKINTIKKQTKTKQGKVNLSQRWIEIRES